MDARVRSICPTAAVATAGLLTAGLAGCSKLTSSDGDGSRSEVGHSGPIRNVVLVVVDTLRRDRVALVPEEGSPDSFLSRLAEESVVFPNALAPSSWTKPSVASLFTGLAPAAHGAVLSEHADDARGHAGSVRLAESFHTLAEHLQRAGFETAAFSANVHVRPETGFAQGFDVFDYEHTRADELFAKARAWLDRRAERPFFLYLHVLDPHAPYRPPEGFVPVDVEPPERAYFTARGESDALGWWLDAFGAADPVGASGPSGERFRFDYEALYAEAVGAKPARRERFPDVSSFRERVELDFQGLDDPALLARVRYLEALYDGEVAFVDVHLGLFVAELARRALLDETLLVVTSDHGEAFLEHGRMGHHGDLSSVQTRVPLLLRLPRPREATLRTGRSARFDELVGLADLQPTLIEALGLPAPTGSFGVGDGRSLWGRVAGTERASAPLDRVVLQDLVSPDGERWTAATRRDVQLLRRAKAGGDVAWTLVQGGVSRSLDGTPGDLDGVSGLADALSAYLERASPRAPDVPGVPGATGDVRAELERLGYL